MRDPATRTMLLVAFAFSWAVAALLAATVGYEAPLPRTLGGFVFMCGPAVGALIARARYSLPREALGLARPNARWMVRAWAWTLALVALSALVSSVLPGVHLDSPAARLGELLPLEERAKLERIPSALLSAGLLGQAAVIGAALNVPLMLSEELGWRGLLWSRTEHLPFWRRSCWIGALWGIWHAPLIALGHNYPGHPIAGIATMVVFCMLLSVTMHHVRERGGTVWHACIIHGTINASATLAALCLRGGDPLVVGVAGAAGCFVLTVNAVWIAYLRRLTPSPNPVGLRGHE